MKTKSQAPSNLKRLAATIDDGAGDAVAALYMITRAVAIRLFGGTP